MKAIAVMPATKSLAIIDLPEPEISSPTDVKLRILEAGVCGTDREICAFQYGTPPQGSPELIIGHESLVTDARNDLAEYPIEVGYLGSY